MGNKHSQGRSSGSSGSFATEPKQGSQQAATSNTHHIPSPTQTQTTLRTPTASSRTITQSPVTASTAARIQLSLDHSSPNASPQSASRRLHYGREQRRSGSRQMDPETAAQIVLQAAGLPVHHHHHHGAYGTGSSHASAQAHAHASYTDSDKPRLGDGVVVGASSSHHSSRRPATAEMLSPVATAIAASIAQNAIAASQLAPLSPRLSPVQPESPTSGRQSPRSFFQRIRPRSDSVSRGHRSSSRAGDAAAASNAALPPASPLPANRQLAAIAGQQTRSRSNSLSGPSSPAHAAHSSAPLGVSELRQLQSMLNHAPSAPTPSLRTHNKREMAQSIPSSSSHGSSSHHRSHRPAAHIRIDRYTTNELMASKEQTYSPIHEPRNSTVEALGMLEDDEQLVNGVPISMTRQYSTPPIAPDGHLPPLSSYYPEPDLTVHSVESGHSQDKVTGGYLIAHDSHKDSHSLSSSYSQHDGAAYNQQRSTSPTAEKATNSDDSSSGDEPHTQFKGSSHQFSFNQSEMLRNQQANAPMQMVVKHG